MLVSAQSAVKEIDKPDAARCAAVTAPPGRAVPSSARIAGCAEGTPRQPVRGIGYTDSVARVRPSYSRIANCWGLRSWRSATRSPPRLMAGRRAETARMRSLERRSRVLRRALEPRVLW